MQNRFGSRVIGTKAFEKAQKIAERGAHIFGHRVVGKTNADGGLLGPKATDIPVPVADPVSDFVATLKPTALKEIIGDADVGEVLKIIDAENAGKQRKGVLDAAHERLAQFNQVMESPTAPSAAVPSVDFAGSSAKDVVAAINSSPELIDQALTAEIQREGGARRTVLKAALQLESDKAVPREPVIAELKALIEGE